MYIAPLRRNFRGADGGRFQCQLNARENRNVFSLDLNVPSESLSVTVLGREFQVAGAEQRIEQNARWANALLANGSDNRVVVAERRVRCAFKNFV